MSIPSAAEIEDRARELHHETRVVRHPHHIRGTVLARKLKYEPLPGAWFDPDLHERDRESDAARTLGDALLRKAHAEFGEAQLEHYARAMVVPASAFACDLRQTRDVRALMARYPYARMRFIEQRIEDMHAHLRARTRLFVVPAVVPPPPPLPKKGLASTRLKLCRTRLELG